MSGSFPNTSAPSRAATPDSTVIQASRWPRVLFWILVASLLPIMWGTSTGAEVMQPLATPVLGGMLSSLAHVLLVTPVIFFWLRERELRRAQAAGVAPASREAVARRQRPAQERRNGTLH